MKIKFFALICLIFILSGCQKPFDFILKKDTFNQTNDQIATTSAPVKTVDPDILKQKIEEEEKNMAEKEKSVSIIKETDEVGNLATSTENITQTFFDLPVLFASQAPFANWDELHEEACEEASMIMADKYFKQESLTPHIMEQGILNLVKWQEENGYLPDLTAAETVYILENYFGLKAKIIYDFDVIDIKNYLLQKKLVIVPAAGRLLGNPNFTGQGPIYHMLVVRGFDEEKKEFITNDPGTRKGNGYRYNYEVLLNAIHDWSHKLSIDGMTNEEIASTPKAIIVVEK